MYLAAKSQRINRIRRREKPCDGIAPFGTNETNYQWFLGRFESLGRISPIAFLGKRGIVGDHFLYFFTQGLSVDPQDLRRLGFVALHAC